MRAVISSLRRGRFAILVAVLKMFSAEATENGHERYPIGVLTAQPALLPASGETELLQLQFVRDRGSVFR